MSAPAHPYELYRLFDRELGKVWRLGQSHLYAYLEKIEEQGLATMEVEASEGAPDRKVYRITPEGKKRFGEWLLEPSPRVRTLRLELLAKLYFYRRLGLKGMDRLAARQRKLLEERLASLDGAMRETDDDYWRSVLDFRRSEIEAIVAWLDRTAALE